MVSDQPDLPAALLRAELHVRVIAEPPDPGPAGDLRRTAVGHSTALWPTVTTCSERKASRWCWPASETCPRSEPTSVRRVIAASRGRSRCFLADHDGRGTTMLIARGVPLNPLYGRETASGETIGSALRHQRSAAVALELGELPDARRDVDTLSDLRFANLLGIGSGDRVAAGSGAGGAGTLPAGRGARPTQGRSLTVLADGCPESVPVRAYDGDPALLVPGRRLHAVRVAGALRCWA